MLVEVTEKPPVVIPVSYMNVGQVGRVVNGLFIGHIILRTLKCWVSLNEPEVTWASWTSPGFQVQILNPGTVIKLTVE